MYICIIYSYPATSTFSGKAGASRRELHAAFQFFGVILSTTPLNVSSVQKVVSPSRCLPGALHAGTCMILSLYLIRT